MRTILLSATALMLLAGSAAFAQTTSNSGSNSDATVTTTSGSKSISSPRVNVIGNPIGNGASSSYSNSNAVSSTRSASRSAAVGNTTTVNVDSYAGNSGGSGADTAGSSGDPTVHYTGGYTVRNTPEVIPPNVMGGNTCAVGASGGLALAGFGIAGGGTWADRACERRQQAALLYNMGEQKAAVELMCQNSDVRDAMKTAGKPCTADIAAAIPAPAAPVARQTTSAVLQIAAVPVAAPVVPALAAKPAAPKPEWCRHAAPTTEPSILYVKKVCGG
ncbi:MAG TPA: hypothetical protein VMB34_01205 [Acetobacteraceae bacterium]|nr:hypothetical protein [Acetobacteraceae bacterium]